MPITDWIGPFFGFGGASVGAYGLWSTNARKNEIDALRAAAEQEDTQRDNARDDDDARSRQWQAMLEHQRLAFEALLGPMRDEIAALGTKVSTLETQVARMRGLLRLALDHITVLRTRWPDTHPIPDLPDALRDEL